MLQCPRQPSSGHLPPHLVAAKVQVVVGKDELEVGPQGVERRPRVVVQRVRETIALQADTRGQDAVPRNVSGQTRSRQPPTCTPLHQNISLRDSPSGSCPTTSKYGMSRTPRRLASYSKGTRVWRTQDASKACVS